MPNFFKQFLLWVLTWKRENVLAWLGLFFYLLGLRWSLMNPKLTFLCWVGAILFFWPPKSQILTPGNAMRTTIAILMASFPAMHAWAELIFPVMGMVYLRNCAVYMRSHYPIPGHRDKVKS